MPKRRCGSFDEAMKRWSSAKLLRTSEFVYAILALFALTQGPVYQVWKSSAERLESLPSPSLPFIYFVSFLVVQLPALLLLARRTTREWLSLRSYQALIVLVVWFGLSVVWSTFARDSLPEFAALVITIAFGVYLGSSFSVREVWWIIALAMAAGVVTSWFAVMRLWDGAYNFIDGYWIGIYFNRNSLAPVAAVAIIAAVAVIVVELGVSSKKPSRVLLVAGASSALIVFSAIEIWKSESQTSPFALAVAAGAVVVWGILRWSGGKISRLRFLVSLAAPITLVILGITLFVALREIGRLGGVSTEVATLNSRRAFWSLSWSAFLEKPLFGWGWMAAWRNPEFFGSGFWNPAWDVAWSHNGYLDILLGGGVLAGLLFGLFVWCGAYQMGRGDVRTTSLGMLLLGFIFSAATQESFFVGSHFLWALMIATLVRSSVDKQHAG